MKNWFTKIKTYYNWGGRFLNDPFHISIKEKTEKEIQKRPSRTEVLNYLLKNFGSKATTYLEIGVRNPKDNFNHINANTKYSVDPGIEFKENPVNFKVTSNEFFKQLRNGSILNPEIKFDVIFVDGLHLADQVDQDIDNAFDFISDEGFLVLHDCNPPSEWHARESYLYGLSPAMNYWNGTTWKAFYKQRLNSKVSCACIDSDWGIGVIAKNNSFGNALKNDLNPFFEYHLLDANRKSALNLMSFEEFKELAKIETLA
jgi:hypothetical protein